MPASTSSKTSVGVSSARASTPLMASATRDISPPDAMRASGRAGSPGLGASRKATSSAPRRVEIRLAPGRRRRPPAESRGRPARRSQRSKPAGGVVPGRRQPGGGLPRRLARAPRRRALRRLRSDSKPARRSASARACGGMGENFLLVAAVLAQQAVQHARGAPRSRSRRSVRRPARPSAGAGRGPGRRPRPPARSRAPPTPS